jgi:Peptidase propeptide and YPEB domain
MKLKTIVCLTGCGWIALSLVSSLLGSEPSQGTLRKQTRLTEPQAQRVALRRVPDGRIQSAELEQEHGRLVWSFDIVRARSKDITEIQVDARAGTVVSQQTETPAQQAAEARSERATKR